MFFELCDLELAVYVSKPGARRSGKVKDVRELVTWLGQQFSGCMLAFVDQGKVVDILNLCVRHDVAVLALINFFSLPARGRR